MDSLSTAQGEVQLNGKKRSLDEQVIPAGKKIDLKPILDEQTLDCFEIKVESVHSTSLSESSNPLSLNESSSEIQGAKEEYASEESEFLKSKEMEEPLLCPDPGRFVLFPIKYPNIFAFYKIAQQLFWTTEEVDTETDLQHWNDPKIMTPALKSFILNVLAFFSASDGIVNENLCLNFAKEVQIAEARQAYYAQMYIEAVHAETYGTLLQTFVTDEEEKKRLSFGHQTIPAVKRKTEWALKWMDSKKASFAERLVAFGCVEGLFFTGSFCSIFYLKSKGLMPGLTFSNELISRDEKLHCEYAAELFAMLIRKCSPAIILRIVKEAVEIEQDFNRYSLQKPILGLNSTLMCKWVQFMGDHVLKMFGCEAYFHTPNPFNWMDLITLRGKTNFFEKRVSDYQKSSVTEKYSSNTKF